VGCAVVAAARIVMGRYDLCQNHRSHAPNDALAKGAAMRFLEYEPDALFRCTRKQSHGTRRRDQLPTYKGSLDCHGCRGDGIRPALEYVGLDRDLPIKDGEPE
jgi:hypothetical protein